MEVEQLWYLPHEIMVVILCRLPVKSLLQFKSVCKLWYSLISSPQFVKMHLNQGFRQRERIMLSSNPYKVVNPVYFMDCSGFYPLERIDFPLTDTGCTHLVYGSCNGLVLIIAYRNSKIFLWNPFMRECREIPSLPNKPISNCRPMYYGLGYDSSTCDYKLVLFIFDHVFASSFESFVFSLKANRWKKKIGTCEYNSGNYYTNPATVVNGALHWVMLDCSVHSKCCHCKVVYFDLADEKLKDMPLPDLGMGLGIEALHLGVLGEYLCILRLERNRVSRYACVWVMKEYGVGESWTNVLNFTYNEPSRGVAPFCFMKDSEIVVEMKVKNALLAVNCVSKTTRFIPIPIRTGHAMPFTHVESLVSVYGGNGSLKRCLKRKK
ncbi:hypothetical protein LguiB_010317 [Lonicera macranthoides]